MLFSDGVGVTLGTSTGTSVCEDARGIESSILSVIT